MRRSRLFVLIGLLFATSSCATQDPTADETSAEVQPAAANERGVPPAPPPPSEPIGKKELAEIEAELQCLSAHFEAEPEELARWVERLFLSRGITADQFEAFKAKVASEPDKWNKRVDEVTRKRKNELCPDGTLSEADLASLALEGDSPAETSGETAPTP